MSAWSDVVLGPEQTADLRPQPEEWEVIAVHHLTHERLDVVAHVARRDREGRDRHLRERRRRRALEVLIVRIRERRERKIGLFLIHLGDPLRMRDRRSPKQYGVL